MLISTSYLITVARIIISNLAYLGDSLFLFYDYVVRLSMTVFGSGALL